MGHSPKELFLRMQKQPTSQQKEFLKFIRQGRKADSKRVVPCPSFFVCPMAPPACALGAFPQLSHWLHRIDSGGMGNEPYGIHCHSMV